MTAGMVDDMRNMKEHQNIPATGAAPRRNGERGQALLEFALALPFMMLLAVGVVDLGRAVYYTVAVNNAATAGAEFGSQTEITAADTVKITNSAVCDANGGSP